MFWAKIWLHPKTKKDSLRLPQITIFRILSLEKISADQQEEKADYPYEDTAQQDDDGCRRDGYSCDQGSGCCDATYYQRHSLEYIRVFHLIYA